MVFHSNDSVFLAFTDCGVGQVASCLFGSIFSGINCEDKKSNCRHAYAQRTHSGHVGEY